jgi:hypothetical protein
VDEDADAVDGEPGEDDAEHVPRADEAAPVRAVGAGQIRMGVKVVASPG